MKSKSMNASFSEARIDLFSRLGTAVKMYGALFHFLVFLALDPWTPSAFSEKSSRSARGALLLTAAGSFVTLFALKPERDGMG